MHTIQIPNRKNTIQNIVAAMLALAVVHGLGRFSFTPLLPYFLDDGFLSLAQGADLASSNYIGYLLGALAAIYFAAPKRLKYMLLLSLLSNVVIMFLQSMTHDFHWLVFWRLLNGVSNGLVFVLAPALVLEWLFMHNKVHLSGLVYLGVGVGLILSGLLVSGTATDYMNEQRWLPIAYLALPMVIYSLWILNKIVLPVRTSAVGVPKKALWDKQSTPLFLHYIGAGLGYILPMTFLPALAQTFKTPENIWIEHVWLVTSISCLLCTPLWNHFGHRLGDRLALLWASVLQGLGILAVLIMPNANGVLICAVLVGCGFLGSVMCTQRLARSFQPEQGPRLSAALITIYAGAQLIAPWLAKWLMAHGFTLGHTFALGLVAFLWSIVFVYFTPKTQ